MEQQASPVGAAASAAVAKIKHLRWYICGLLFFATVVNYIDRQVLGTLAPELQTKIGWTESEYSHIVIWFQIAYGAMFLLWGGVLDRIGVKLGFAIALVIWSLAGMSHALATTAVGFMAARFLLGVGEAANFPASLKTVAEWFPETRARVGDRRFQCRNQRRGNRRPITALTLSEGLRLAKRVHFHRSRRVFVADFLGGCSIKKPEENPRLSKEEFELIRSDKDEETAGENAWMAFPAGLQTTVGVFHRQNADRSGLVVLSVLAAEVPRQKFRDQRHRLDSLPDRRIHHRGCWLSRWRLAVFFAYKTRMDGQQGAQNHDDAICHHHAAGDSGYYVKSAWTAVILIGIAAGAHQGWSANLFTLTADMFPRKAVGSIVGIGSCAGAAGGILLPLYIGKVLDANPSFYLPLSGRFRSIAKMGVRMELRDWIGVEERISTPACDCSRRKAFFCDRHFSWHCAEGSRPFIRAGRPGFLQLLVGGSNQRNGLVIHQGPEKNRIAKRKDSTVEGKESSQ